MWKDILKKDSRITSHQRKGKKELDRRYGDNPDKQLGLEELEGEQVASAHKEKRPLPYRGAQHESNRARGDYNTAEKRANAETIEFLQDDNNFRIFVMPIISKTKAVNENAKEKLGRNISDDTIRFRLEHALKKDAGLKRSLESKGVEYKFINWADVSNAFQDDLDYLR
jgi:hypothetical protein